MYFQMSSVDDCLTILINQTMECCPIIEVMSDLDVSGGKLKFTEKANLLCGPTYTTILKLIIVEGKNVRVIDVGLASGLGVVMKHIMGCFVVMGWS